MLFSQYIYPFSFEAEYTRLLQDPTIQAHNGDLEPAPQLTQLSFASVLYNYIMPLEKEKEAS